MPYTGGQIHMMSVIESKEVKFIATGNRMVVTRGDSLGRIGQTGQRI
jgi:hypothetical protein